MTYRTVAALMTAAVLVSERPQSSVPASSPAARAGGHLRIDGTRLIKPDGSTFLWRGITAFRLLEMIAHGRTAEAERFLDWAAAQRLTVVRVLTMAKHLFELTPDEGRAALPRLLAMAADRGLYVEIVALADTAAVRVDVERHIREVGATAAEHGNALIEIANEPYHPTQAPWMHHSAELLRLAKLLPDAVPVALGSAEHDERFSAGEYATFHFPRGAGRDGWEHVIDLSRGAAMLAKWKKPLVSDEPIGAGAEPDPNHRDSDPARFRAAALMSRLVGMGATFHYEEGLQALVPDGRVLACFDAWSEAWTLLPDDIEQRGQFRKAGDHGAAAAGFDSRAAAAAFERSDGKHAWILLLDVRSDPGLRLAPGWTIERVNRLDRVWLVSAAHGR